VDPAEWLTRGTIWLALSLYVAAETVAAFGTGDFATRSTRWLNGLGFVAFLLHVVCAFHFYHQWSHSVAYADTARQTAEFSGRNWGGGLYLNYLFALLWLGESMWSWVSPTTFAFRPRWVGWFFRAFFMLMIFNGAVVFARSPARWYGAGLCALLAISWWRRRRPRDHKAPAAKTA
jgi:hypothetical protein